MSVVLGSLLCVSISMVHHSAAKALSRPAMLLVLVSVQGVPQVMFRVPGTTLLVLTGEGGGGIG